MLNNYALKLKATNPWSNVVVMAERDNPNELLVFQKIYICLNAVRDGLLANCRCDILVFMPRFRLSYFLGSRRAFLSFRLCNGIRVNSLKE